MANGNAIKYKDRASISGTMEECMKESGRITTCMGKALTNIQMADSTLGHTSTTREMVMESSHTLMEDNSKAYGSTDYNMVKVYSFFLVVNSAKANGSMVKE